MHRGPIVVFAVLILVGSITPAFSQTGTRANYIYDNAGIISEDYEALINDHIKKLDSSTTAQIVIYTIPSFVGHGIKKDGQEIQDRDMLANYIFNEVSLDGYKGIGQRGKDNGVLILYSLQRDAGGSSMRIEVGRGLEGNITDGTAGAILDAYLVPAREEYESSGDIGVYDSAFYNTVLALSERIGYVGDDSSGFQEPAATFDDEISFWIPLLIFLAVGILIFATRRGRRRGGYYGWGGGWSGGGGFGGGGGSGGGSGGGGAGR